MADYTNNPNTVRTANVTHNERDEIVADDHIQHGIDDSPTGDATKGAILGGVGGAIVGALAGGPIGAVIGALVGGGVSGAAVAAVDAVDNDDNISGVGTEIATDGSSDIYSVTAEEMAHPRYRKGYRYDETSERYIDPATGRFIDPNSGRYVDVAGNYIDPVVVGANNPLGNGMPGIQTGGHHTDGTPDTRGILEKTSDAVTGDNLDDKTGKPVDNSYGWDTRKRSVYDNATTVGNGVPGVQTGGRVVDGSADTRGVTEKVADVVTGDNLDDKTGKRVS